VRAADGTDRRDERALVVGPLAVPGFLLVLIGVRQRRRLFVLLGAVMVGLAVKLVDRPRETAGAVQSDAEEAGASTPSPEPEAVGPPTQPAEPAKPRRPRASATPKPPADEEQPSPADPEPDQPEPG
jgi:outer membrane biosynthesis protein TonB